MRWCCVTALAVVAAAAARGLQLHNNKVEKEKRNNNDKKKKNRITTNTRAPRRTTSRYTAAALDNDPTTGKSLPTHGGRHNRGRVIVRTVVSAAHDRPGVVYIIVYTTRVYHGLFYVSFAAAHACGYRLRYVVNTVRLGRRRIARELPCKFRPGKETSSSIVSTMCFSASHSCDIIIYKQTRK